MLVYLEEIFLQEGTQERKRNSKEQWQYSHIQHAVACDPVAWHTMVGLLCNTTVESW